jgi:hypothetical protein
MLYLLKKKGWGNGTQPTSVDLRRWTTLYISFRIQFDLTLFRLDCWKLKIDPKNIHSYQFGRFLFYRGSVTG